MNRLILQKGNLYNQLENKFDKHLIDSSQYDLKTTVGKDTRYYRLRSFASHFDAMEVSPSSFRVPKYNKCGIQINEVADFRKTELYKNNFPYHNLFHREFINSNNSVPSYYAFLQRVTDKNNINNSKELYNFSVPAIGNREKNGVASYDIDIELVRNRYYIVFFKENVKSGYFQCEDPQYVIYEKKDFLMAKDDMSDLVIDLAIEKGYPLKLLEYVYIMTGGDIKLIAQFFHSTDNIHSFSELCSTPFFSFIEPNIKSNNELAKELTRYFNQEQDDINYSFNNKDLVKK